MTLRPTGPRLPLLLAVAWLGAACGGEPDMESTAESGSAADPIATPPSTATAIPPELPSAQESLLPQLAADSALEGEALARTLALLQSIADTATIESIAAPALLRLGWLKLRLYPFEAPDSAVLARPDDFAFDEIGGGWVYLGNELAVLLERFPEGPLADDAAYAQLSLALGGECEGFIDCYANSATRRERDFLRQYPASGYAAGVVARTNEQLASVFLLGGERGLLVTTDLTQATEYHDPAAVQREIESYQEALGGLPPETAAPALFLLADLWERFRRDDLAEAIYRQVLQAPGAVSSDSIRMRLERLR